MDFFGARTTEEPARTASGTVVRQMHCFVVGERFHLGCHRFQNEMETASKAPKV